jgi:hypothetical protein
LNELREGGRQRGVGAGTEKTSDGVLVLAGEPQDADAYFFKLFTRVVSLAIFRAAVRLWATPFVTLLASALMAAGNAAAAALGSFASSATRTFFTIARTSAFLA